MTPKDKQSIRQHIRHLRRSLSIEQQEKAGEGLLKNLKAMNLFANGDQAGFYLANDGEIDPAKSLQHAIRNNIRCVLPIIPAKGERLLFFGDVNGQIRYQPNRFGIPEPVVSESQCFGVDQLDWLLVPLVAFDAAGNRIGMGGGFYDTTLAARVDVNRPRVIGVAHEVQKVEEIPSDHWDIPISTIVTDENIYHI